MVTLPIDKIGNQEYVVAPQIKSDLILGSDFLTKFDITYIDHEVTPPIA
jgi:hypothetical protein